MLLNILMIVGGIALVLWGADRLTDGAVAIASKFGISQIVIGLTIVAMGTSMPEFCVSMASAINGTTAMAVGNVIGSNIFNAMLIVGIAAMITPIAILPSTVRKDIPFALIASVLLVLLCIDGGISRWDGLLLLALFAVFMFMTLRGVKSGSKEPTGEEAEEKAPMSPLLAVLWMVVGLGCLVGGSDVFVRGASAVAKAWGISDAVIGLTVVAMGTSLRVQSPYGSRSDGCNLSDGDRGYHSRRPDAACRFDDVPMAILLYQTYYSTLGGSISNIAVCVLPHVVDC